MITVNDLAIIHPENPGYAYQPDLTPKLDNLSADFTQETINEIVLWKVNRYAMINTTTLNLLNQVTKADVNIDTELTKQLLFQLLGKEHKGIRLPIASAILRFKNPTIYQIIDQRVYRFIYGVSLKYKATDLNQQVSLYLNYLIRLREICVDKKVPFENADRIFYSLDQLHNADIKLDGY